MSSTNSRRGYKGFDFHASNGGSSRVKRINKNVVGGEYVE